jgi:hypothetical protein
MQPPKDYWSLLPKHIKSKAFENIPYTEILYKCEEFCDSEDFWVRKAAVDTGNKLTPEFKEFFNEGKGDLKDKYLRVLAYNNVAVPGDKNNFGSELYMAPSQMLKIGVDRKDRELIYWSLDRFDNLDNDIFDYSELLKPLYRNNMFEELLYIIPKLPKDLYVNFPYSRWLFGNDKARNFVSELDDVLPDGEEKNDYYTPLRELYNKLMEDKELTNEDLRDPHYLDLYYQIKRKGISSPVPDIQEFLNNGQGLLIAKSMIDAGYIDEAFSLFKDKLEELDYPDIYGSFVNYIADNDNINLAKKIYNNLSNSAKNDYLISVLINSYSGSKVFEWAYPLADFKGFISEYTAVVDSRTLAYKSLLDFEGLYRISKLLDKEQKERFTYRRNFVNSYQPAIIEIFMSYPQKR